MNPNYPVYVITKGRWESRLTTKYLTAMDVPHHVVIEPQEYDQYAAVVDPKKILVLPFSDLGRGSIPARNWVWEHSIEAGAERHWIMDDNIRGFYRLNRNQKTPVGDGTIFRCIEDFVNRYENVALAGPHYFMFAPRRTKRAPFILNSRVYSCILIRNELTHRWRGRYNEDTDLSLRALKEGWVTVLFYAFLANKTATMRMKGGNTEELYGRKHDEDYDPENDGRLKMAQSLVDQHPDVAKVAWRWGRWQHYVDYRPFERNRLIRKPSVVIEPGVNEYGMQIREIGIGPAEEANQF